MEQTLADQSCAQFASLLASKAPVPGGGGAAALTGALAAALCAMAGNLTIGKKKYASYEEDLSRMLRQLEQLRGRFLELIDADAAAFEPLSRAYSMPKDDSAYAETMERVTLGACQAPLEMMRCCSETAELLCEMQEKCSPLMLSDVGCGASLALAALNAAAMNVYVNTRLLRGCAEAERIATEADAIRERSVPRCHAVEQNVLNRLKES